MTWRAIVLTSYASSNTTVYNGLVPEQVGQTTGGDYILSGKYNLDGDKTVANFHRFGGQSSQWYPVRTLVEGSSAITKGLFLYRNAAVAYLFEASYSNSNARILQVISFGTFETDIVSSIIDCLALNYTTNNIDWSKVTVDENGNLRDENNEPIKITNDNGIIDTEPDLPANFDSWANDEKTIYKATDGNYYTLGGLQTNNPQVRIPVGGLPNGVYANDYDGEGNIIGSDGNKYDSETGEKINVCNGTEVIASDNFVLSIFGYNSDGDEISDTVNLTLNDSSDKAFTFKSWSSDSHKLMTKIRRIILRNNSGRSIGDGSIKIYGVIAGIAINDSESTFVDNVIGRWELIATASFSRCSQYATVEINKTLKIGEHLDWGDLTYRFLGLRGDYRLEYNIIPFVGKFCCDDYNEDEKGSGSSGSNGDSTGTTEITEKLDDLIDKFDDLIEAIKGIQLNDVEVVVTPSDNVSIAKIQYRLSDSED